MKIYEVAVTKDRYEPARAYNGMKTEAQARLFASTLTDAQARRLEERGIYTRRYERGNTFFLVRSDTDRPLGLNVPSPSMRLHTMAEFAVCYREAA